MEVQFSSLSLEEQQLVTAAKTVKDNAYHPHSGFKFGAAVLTDSNKIFAGCSVDNAAYPLSTCAERVAVANAVSEGEKTIKAVAVFANLGNTFPSPCGGCRQIISEFGYASDCVVIMAKYPGNECLRTTIKLLLPHAFTPDTLMKYTRAKSLK